MDISSDPYCNVFLFSCCIAVILSSEIQFMGEYRKSFAPQNPHINVSFPTVHL